MHSLTNDVDCEDLFDMAISSTMDVVNLNVQGRKLHKIDIIYGVYRSSPFVKRKLMFSLLLSERI